MTLERANLHKLNTERRNSASTDLDTMSALEIAEIMNAEDRKIAGAVEKALPQIAEAIDAIANAIAIGGRLIYVGAGTSGRIAALDASECPPTFGVSPKTVQFVMAGGTKTLGRAKEFSEDSRASGERDMARRKPGKRDVVVGLAASGRTPYTVAALQLARKRGAQTVALACNPDSELGRSAHIEIVADVGPEVLSGSTRMKAATAQKMVLNMLTTGAMARLGRVYGNLMAHVETKNLKLAQRALSILQEAAGVDRQTAIHALKSSGNRVPVALIMLKTGLTSSEAVRKLNLHKGNVRQALAAR